MLVLVSAILNYRDTYLQNISFLSVSDSPTPPNSFSPAEHHDFINASGAARGRGLAEACLDEPEHLVIGNGRERLLGNGPDLKEHHSITPHITVRRVPFIEKCLQSGAIIIIYRPHSAIYSG